MSYVSATRWRPTRLALLGGAIALALTAATTSAQAATAASIPATVGAHSEMARAAGLGAVSPARAHANDPGTIYDTIRFSSPGGPWQEWLPPKPPPLGGTFISYPDVSGDAYGNDTISVIMSTGWWIVQRHPDGSWGAWTRPPSQPPVLTTSEGDSFQTYSTTNSYGDTEFYQMDDSDNGLYVSTMYPGGIPSPWVETTNVPYGTSSIAVTTAGTGAGTTVQVMALAPSGYMYHNIWTQARQWQGWQEPQQLPPGGPLGTALSIAAAGMPNGNAQFIAIGRDGTIYHDIRYANGGWQGWAAPLQPPAGWDSSSNNRITAAADSNGNAQFMIWSFNLSSGLTTLYHDIRYANGSWQDGWGKPPLPPGDHRCGGSVAITTFDPNNTDLHVDALCFSS